MIQSTAICNDHSGNARKFSQEGNKIKGTFNGTLTRIWNRKKALKSHFRGN